MNKIFSTGGRNVLALAGIQGGNALIPLIAFPMLYTFLSDESFSHLVIAEALSLYILTLSGYAFDISGVRRVAQIRNEQKGNDLYRLQDYLGAVVVARILVYLCVTGVSLVVVYVFFDHLFYFLLLWVLYPLGNLLQFTFLYQAEEKNFTLFNIVFYTRLASVAALTLLAIHVRDPLLLLAPIALGYFVSGVVSFSYVHRRYGILIKKGTLKKSFRLLTQGWSLFVGNSSVILLRGSNVLIVSFALGDPSVTSLYALAEKYIKLTQALVRPLNQHYLAKGARSVYRSADLLSLRVLVGNAKKQLLFVLVLVFIANGSLLLGNFFFPWISFINVDFVLVYALMSIAVGFGVANYVLGYLGLVFSENSASFTKSVLISGFFTVVTCYYGSQLLGVYGAASSYVLGEVMLFVLMAGQFFGLQKKMNNIKRRGCE